MASKYNEYDKMKESENLNDADFTNIYMDTICVCHQ